MKKADIDEIKKLHEALKADVKAAHKQPKKYKWIYLSYPTPTPTKAEIAQTGIAISSIPSTTQYSPTSYQAVSAVMKNPYRVKVSNSMVETELVTLSLAYSEAFTSEEMLAKVVDNTGFIAWLKLTGIGTAHPFYKFAYHMTLPECYDQCDNKYNVCVTKQYSYGTAQRLQFAELYLQAAQLAQVLGCEDTVLRLCTAAQAGRLVGKDYDRFTSIQRFIEMNQRDSAGNTDE